MRKFLTVLFLSAFLAWPGALSAQNRPEFRLMYNGKDLSGWTPDEKTKDSWSANGDTIVFDGKNRGWLMFNKEFENVYLQLEYRVEKDGNSGIALRTPRGSADPALAGMEIQLVDDDFYEARQPPLRFHTSGALYGVLEPSKKAAKPAGEWNSMVVLVRDNILVVQINDVTVIQTKLDELKDYDTKKFVGVKRKKGHFGLQGHIGRVEFRKLTYGEVKK